MSECVISLLFIDTISIYVSVQVSSSMMWISVGQCGLSGFLIVYRGRGWYVQAQQSHTINKCDMMWHKQKCLCPELYGYTGYLDFHLGHKDIRNGIKFFYISILILIKYFSRFLCPYVTNTLFVALYSLIIWDISKKVLCPICPDSIWWLYWLI